MSDTDPVTMRRLEEANGTSPGQSESVLGTRFFCFLFFFGPGVGGRFAHGGAAERRPRLRVGHLPRLARPHGPRRRRRGAQRARGLPGERGPSFLLMSVCVEVLLTFPLPPPFWFVGDADGAEDRVGRRPFGLPDGRRPHLHQRLRRAGPARSRPRNVLRPRRTQRFPFFPHVPS